MTGVFETLLARDGRAAFVEDHLARLRRGAAALGLTWPDAPAPRTLLAETFAALAAAGGAPRVVRLTLSAAGASVATRPFEPPPAAGVALLSSAPSTGAASDPAPRPEVKATERAHYDAVRRAARAAGAWEGLLTNARGDLAEGSITNVFLVRDRTLRTPGDDQGCLAGVVRARLLASLEDRPLDGLTLAVGRVPTTALLDADEVLLTNAVVGVVAVRRLLFPSGGRSRALPGAEGSCARALVERLHELVRTERGAAQAHAGRDVAPG